MKHGRKSKSRRIDGYKRHLAVDMDTALILACALAPANRPEGESATDLAADLQRAGMLPDSCFFDRAYVNTPLVNQVANDNGEAVCRPWQSTNRGHFPKSLFKIDLRRHTITCPEGNSEAITLGATVEFDPATCDVCPRRGECTSAAPGRGRTVTIGQNEAMQERFRKLLDTPSGRAKLRERVVVEHLLAHAGRRQGKRARYLGVRRNLWDWRRASAITNLETVNRRLTPAAAPAEKMAA